MIVATTCCWHLLATIVAVDAKRRKVCMLHAARDFARGIRAFLRLSLAHVTKSIPLALILKSERGTHFAGWSGRLVQSVDFHWFSTASPLPFLTTPEPLLPKPPKITKNGRAATHSKPVVLSKAVSCAVWEGLVGRREELTEKWPGLTTLYKW